MKTQQQRDELSTSLFKWATQQHASGMSVNGFNIDTCTRSGSIWFQKSGSAVYLNYDFDLCGDVINGHIEVEGNVIGTVSDIDCARVETLDSLVTSYIDTVKRVTEYL